MRRIKELITEFGYNAKERTYIYSGAILGAVAPIIGARYLLSPGLIPSTDSGWMEEAVLWGGSLLLNASSMFAKPHLPIPFYTASGGVALGNSIAMISRRKRLIKEIRLENIAIADENNLIYSDGGPSGPNGGSGRVF